MPAEKDTAAKWPAIPRGWDLEMLTEHLIVYMRKKDFLKVRLVNTNKGRALQTNKKVTQKDFDFIEKHFGGKK